jgi:hypothetical protein
MKRTIQKPVFTRVEVESYVGRHFTSPPKGYRVKYQDNALRYHKNTDSVIVLTLDQIDWDRVRAITVLFTTPHIHPHPTEGTVERDGVRLNPNLLRRVT